MPPVKTVDLHEAKPRLSRPIAEVEAGGEVVLARHGKPVARLVRIGPGPAQRRFGAMRGRARAGAAFFEPRPGAEIAAWERAPPMSPPNEPPDRPPPSEPSGAPSRHPCAALVARRRPAAPGGGAQAAIADPGRVVLVSAASAWESATGHRLGKLPGAAEVAADVAGCVAAQGFEPLAITLRGAARAGRLPGPPRDPFDRMLIARAGARDLVLVSDEALFDGYGVRRPWRGARRPGERPRRGRARSARRRR